MSIKRYTISKDPNYYESFTDLAQLENGDLLCVFNEINAHDDRLCEALILKIEPNLLAYFMQEEFFLNFVCVEGLSY